MSGSDLVVELMAGAADYAARSGRTGERAEMVSAAWLEIELVAALDVLIQTDTPEAKHYLAVLRRRLAAAPKTEKMEVAK